MRTLCLWFIAFTFCGNITSTAMAQSVVINEIMASNGQIIKDNFGEYDDWVELYNEGEVSVDIGGMYITDDLNNLTLWQIPDRHPQETTISPGGFLILWFDRDIEQGVLHIQAKLKKGGETVALIASDGRTIIDSIVFEAQKKDISFGRTPRKISKWGFFSKPSPGGHNGSTSSFTQIKPPQFSIDAGFYAKRQTLHLDTPEGDIYYSLQTSDDHTDINRMASPKVDKKYAGHIPITQTTVVRAYTKLKDQPPSDIITRTFFIDESSTLPVVSLAVEPEQLFAEATGLYMQGPDIKPDEDFPYWNANYYKGSKYYKGRTPITTWRDYEIPVHLEYFNPDGKPGFTSQAGLEIAGGWSRGLPKKSFNIKNRKQYGQRAIHYPLFPENPYTEYDGITLRAGGQDRARINNEIINMATNKAKLHVAMQAYKPCLLFINGAYWGIYSLQERKDDGFIKNRYGYGDIVFFKGRIRGRSTKGYESLASRELLSLFEQYDITQDKVYEQIKQRVNMESYIDMWLLNVYSGRGDIDNNRYWHRSNYEGKLHWICYDFDWLSPSNYPTLKTYAEKSIDDSWMLTTLLKNDAFRSAFLNRMADFLNTTGSPKTMSTFIDKAVADVAGEIDRDLQRWRIWSVGSETHLYDKNSYKLDVAKAHTFVSKRPAYLRAHIVEYFNLGGTAPLKLNSSTGGSITVNSITPDFSPWSGTYFQGVPVTITATPDAQHRFGGWLEKGLPNQQRITLDVKEHPTATARFIPM